MDRVWKSRVNEMSGLNSSIQPSWLNLTNNEGFITSRKLGRTSTMIVFPVCMHSLLDSDHSRLSQTSSLLNISNRISSFKQRDDRSTVGSRGGSHGGGKRLSWIPTCQSDTNNITWHCLLFPQSLGTLFWLKKLKNMENNRCSQNCPNESQLCFVHYSTSFHWNHMTLSILESQDNVVCWTKIPGPWLM